jgi:hypothetical protein
VRQDDVVRALPRAKDNCFLVEGNRRGFRLSPRSSIEPLFEPLKDQPDVR